MINLLAQHHKKQLRIEYYIRFAVIIINTATALMVIALILLIPTFITAFERERIEYSLSQELHTREDFLAHQEATDEIERIRTQLMIINDQADTRVYTDRLAPIMEVLGEGVVLRAISLHHENNTMRIQGQAMTRETLLAMIARIEAVPFVERVDVPVSSFLQSVDIPFLINIDLIK